MDIELGRSQEVLLYNPIRMTVFIETAIFSEFGSEDATVTLVHKTEFRNKLRRVQFSLKGLNGPIINGVPGPMSFTDGNEYKAYQLTIPTNIMKDDWLGDWSVHFSYGTIDEETFSARVVNYLEFVEPNLDIKEISTNELAISISKLDEFVYLGRLFTLDSSELNGVDVLGPNNE